MNWLLIGSIPILIAVLWIYTSALTSAFPTLSNKRICLLIAHPDDEAMFFAPILQALTHPSLGNRIMILCLSTGNADGLGATRKKELAKSGVLLGLRSSDDVYILDDPRFQDSMTAEWDVKALTEMLTNTFAPTMAKKKATEKPEAGVDVLITFDARGVSSHPNHIALHHAAVAFAKTIMSRHAGWEAPVKVYALTTVNVLRKYLSVLDAPWTIFTMALKKRQAGEYPTPLLVVSGMFGYRKAQRAMTEAHVSQMRWFRWGWIGVARYMVLNDLQKVKIIT